MKELRKESIIVVEDDPVYMNLIVKELEKLGYTNIKTFATGKEVLSKLDFKPDIAFLDYWLEKDLTGLDVLLRIKKMYPYTQVIFLTASDDVNIAVNTMKNGAYDYIVKGETAFIRIRHLLKKISDEHERKTRSRSIIQFQIIVIIMIIIVSILGILYYHYIHD
ncbi:MAG: response regulator [Bacteroidales bacterium]|nr:response regulator [Bacteroidales bacterium]